MLSNQGWKSSMTLPDGSSQRICDPPGPFRISFRNRVPVDFKLATSDGKSLTWIFTKGGSGDKTHPSHA